MCLWTGDPREKVEVVYVAADSAREVGYITAQRLWSAHQMFEEDMHAHSFHVLKKAMPVVNVLFWSQGHTLS